MSKKYFCNPENIVSNLKKTVSEKWEEKANTEKERSHKKMYKRMVDEAVLLINARWETNAKYGVNTDYPADVLEITSHNVFFITEELKIYSHCGYLAENPDTKCCCFFDAFTFSSEEEKQKYIKDILKELPEGTVYETNESEDFVLGKCLNYIFKIKISMK